MINPVSCDRVRYLAFGVWFNFLLGHMNTIMANVKVRLYVDHSLGEGQSVPLSRDKAHYLFSVMRMGPGDQLFVINGKDGEYLAEIRDAGKRGGTLVCLAQSRPLKMPPDLWLLFAPIKKARTDFIVEKATEMGASKILPVQTDFTNSERIRQDRLQAHAIEAAEQCAGTYVPEVLGLQKLDHLLDHWPSDRQLMFCNETLAGQANVLDPTTAPSWAILIGPEGGFSMRERDRLASFAAAHPVSLGPRILRADTAVVAAMTLWQIRYGDWLSAGQT